MELLSTKCPSFTIRSCFALSISNTIISLSRFILSPSSARSFSVLSSCVSSRVETRSCDWTSLELRRFTCEKRSDIWVRKEEMTSARGLSKSSLAPSDGRPARIRNYGRIVRRWVFRELIELSRLSRSTRCTFKNNRWTRTSSFFRFVGLW
jgi:hypothetical protein